MRLQLPVCRRAVAGIAVPIALAAAAFAASPATAGPAASEACTSGVRTVNGVQARVFCGPARATAFVNGKRYAFANGECELRGKYVAVNIGTVMLGAGKGPALSYFGLLMGKHPAAPPAEPAVAKDGTYRGGLVTMTARGLAAGASLYGAPNLKITLRNNRRAGSFSGTMPGSKLTNRPALKVRGSFTC
jgi:hypothetical protein